MSSKILNAASSYLNKQCQRKYPNSETIFEIALQAWRDHLFTHLNQKVADAALRMLERNRNGEWINEEAIKAVVSSYIELGTLETPNENNNTEAHLTVSN